MELLEEHYDRDHRAKKMVEGKVTYIFFCIVVMLVHIYIWYGYCFNL